MVCFSSNTAFGCGFQGDYRLSEDVLLKSPTSLFPSVFSKLEYFLWIKWSICDVNVHHSNAKQVNCLTVWNAKKSSWAESTFPRADRLIYKVNSCEKVITRPGVWLSVLVPVLLAYLNHNLCEASQYLQYLAQGGKSTFCTVTVHLMTRMMAIRKEVMMKQGAIFVRQTLLCLS